MLPTQAYIGHDALMQPLELSDNCLKPLEKKPEPVTEAAADPLPRSFERFTLLNRVARGGMGEVYLAAARSIEGAERPLIVKIIRPDHIEDRSFLARFLDEARIQSQLSHPGVAQILEATNDANGKPYVVVEYVEGRNLSDLRTRAGQLGVRISWPEALAIGVCLGEGLAHVHERTDAEGRPLEIVHRDLSPQNVMVGYGGEVKLIDFGTARGQNRRCQTIAGVVFAKPGYVAPEVANNTPGGVPADLYAWGVILWELLAGRRFLTGDASAHLAAVAAGRRSLPPLARLVGAPAEIDAVLAKLTANEISERYVSARAALQDLVKILQRAPSMADGDRSVRGRISDLMRRLYPAEPARSRADFVRRVAEARATQARIVPTLLSPEPPETNDPTRLAGTPYRLVRQIGCGGMGTVHEAVHVDLGRTVALKILETDAMSVEAERRFRSEARAIAQLDQDNLVKVYDFGKDRDGRLYYVMELLAGATLAEKLEREGRLPQHAVIDAGIQVCRALEAAHRAGVIHRDIKPANLFATMSGTLKVLDFGVAKSASAEAEQRAAEAVTLVGTPEYMAPEQAHGHADARSDIYALGVVLYELLTGDLPFMAQSPLVLMEQKSASAPARLRHAYPELDVSAALDALIERALDPKPDRRPESAAAFRRELEALLAPPQSKRTVARSTRSLAVSALIVAAVAGLLGASTQIPGVNELAQHGFGMVVGRAASLAQSVKERRAALVAARAHASAGLEPSAPKLVHAKAEPKPEPLPPAAKAEAEALAAAVEPLDLDAQEQAPAVQDAQATVKSEPADAGVANVLRRAKELTDKGRQLGALALLRRAAAREPNSPELLAALAAALEKDHSWGEALRAAQRRAELDTSAEAQLALARLERATGHRDRAVTLLTKLAADQSAGAEARELLKSLGAPARVAMRD